MAGESKECTQGTDEFNSVFDVIVISAIIYV